MEQVIGGSENFSLIFPFYAFKRRSGKTRERERARFYRIRRVISTRCIVLFSLSLSLLKLEIISRRAKQGDWCTRCSEFERNGEEEFCGPRSFGLLGEHAMFGKEKGVWHDGHLVFGWGKLVFERVENKCLVALGFGGGWRDVKDSVRNVLVYWA